MALLVYKLTCTTSAKAYVGITARALDTRWLEHCARSRQGVRESRLYDAMRKYGLDVWTREVIATADTEDEARALERHFIEALGTYDNGYNANLGGCGWLTVPDDVRRKIGAAQKGKIISAKSRERMASAKLFDSRCAKNFGEHTQKGRANPRSHSFVIEFPDGSEHIVRGLREFCRAHGLHYSHIRSRGRGHSKGFKLLRRMGPTGAGEAPNQKGV